MALNSIGPLQTAYAKYSGNIPANAEELRLPLSLLDALEAMQDPTTGAVFYAPRGTADLRDETEISNENNFSLLAGLRMLRQVLGDQHPQTARVQRLITGIENHFSKNLYLASQGIFSRGGFLRKDSAGQPRYVAYDDLAVDVQTWGITVLSADWVDRNFGEGTAHTIWTNTKQRSGVIQNGVLQGVGFTDSNDILSGEWTMGAVLMAKEMARHYRAAHADWATELDNDVRTMRQGVESLRTTDADGAISYKYANKRYFIPFGWWANPIPSIASSAWVAFADSNFNPFVLGGQSGARLAVERPEINALEVRDIAGQLLETGESTIRVSNDE